MHVFNAIITCEISCTSVVAPGEQSCAERYENEKKQEPAGPLDGFKCKKNKAGTFNQ